MIRVENDVCTWICGCFPPFLGGDGAGDTHASESRIANSGLYPRSYKRQCDVGKTRRCKWHGDLSVGTWTRLNREEGILLQYDMRVDPPVIAGGAHGVHALV